VATTSLLLETKSWNFNIRRTRKIWIVNGKKLVCGKTRHSPALGSFGSYAPVIFIFIFVLSRLEETWTDTDPCTDPFAMGSTNGASRVPLPRTASLLHKLSECRTTPRKTKKGWGHPFFTLRDETTWDESLAVTSPWNGLFGKLGFSKITDLKRKKTLFF